MDVWNAERDLIHYAEEVFFGIGGDIEHELDPIGSVGNLQVQPIGFAVLHTAVPIDVEPQNVFVEVFHRGLVAHHKACVDDSTLPRWRYWRTVLFCSRLAFHKLDKISLGIPDGKAGFLAGHLANFNAL